jgi:glycine/D-amino acid oxidase-like deaminating enzyme
MTKDVIIIGGGIIGCAMAFELAGAGLSVVLLEQGELAQGITGNSFAWANASSKTGDEGYHRLNAAGVEAYQKLAEKFGADRFGINPCGALYAVPPDDTIGCQAMRDEFAVLQGYDYPCRWLSADDLADECSGLAFSEGTEGVLFPSDMVIDAPKAAQAFADLAKDAGAVVRQDCVAMALLADDDGVVQGVGTEGGPIYASKVILAAGRDTGRVLSEMTGYDGFALRFPLREVPGLLLTTPPLDPNPLGRIYFGSTTNELHLLPAPNGGIRIGSDDVDGIIWDDHSEEAKKRGGQALLDRASQVLPGLKDRVALDNCTLQIGVRPYPEDGRSIVGPLPGAEGLFVVATHSGITLAPVIAAHVTRLVKGEEVPELDAFSLSRFPGF